jgi:hypothetical protein
VYLLKRYGEQECRDEWEFDDFLLKKTQKNLTTLNRFILFDQEFSWKEQDLMEIHIQEMLNEGTFSHVYDANPGEDGWHLVFSKVELPAAQSLHPKDLVDKPSKKFKQHKNEESNKEKDNDQKDLDSAPFQNDDSYHKHTDVDEDDDSDESGDYDDFDPWMGGTYESDDEND